MLLTSPVQFTLDQPGMDGKPETSERQLQDLEERGGKDKMLRIDIQDAFSPGIWSLW